MLLQVSARQEKTALHGTYRDADGERDLFVTQIFFVVEKENRSQFVAHARDSRLDDLEKFFVEHDALGIPSRIRYFEGFTFFGLLDVRLRGAPVAASSSVDAQIVSNFEEPGPERAAAVEPREALKGADEDLLGDVEGVFAVLAHPAYEAQDPGLVGVDNAPEGLEILAATLLDECLLRRRIEPQI
jgi:hypothetical protein